MKVVIEIDVSGPAFEGPDGADMDQRAAAMRHELRRIWKTWMRLCGKQRQLWPIQRVKDRFGDTVGSIKLVVDDGEGGTCEVLPTTLNQIKQREKLG